MKDKISNITTFAFIGKPNNGKSSMISALTFDDTIEVSKKVGTTTESNKYSYIYKNEVITNFYDTPGFEKAKSLWVFIKKNKNSSNYGNNLLRDFIETYKEDVSYEKDIQILNAILDSDFIVFIINISEKYRETIRNELEIISFIKKPIIILFNQINNKNYSEEWKNELKKYSLTNIHNFNPMDNSYSNIESIYKSLYLNNIKENEINSIEKILTTYNIHLSENKKKSATIISQMLLEMLQLNYSKKINNNENITIEKNKILNEFQNRLYEIEHKYQKEINKTWGYSQIKVIDNRENFDSNENIKLGLSQNRFIGLGVIMGGGVGIPFAPFDFGIATFVAAGIGGVGAYIVSKKYHSLIISNETITYSIEQKNINISFIILKRALEHLHMLIKHGHANREDIIIPIINEELKYNKEWNFEKNDEKEIIKIHKSFVKDENSNEYLKKLEKLLLKYI